jgi:GT2 family glycosyltransferase
MPRRLALGTYAIAVLCVLVVLGVAGSNHRSSLAFTGAAGSVGEVAKISPGGRACDPVGVAPSGFDGIQIPLYSARAGTGFIVSVVDQRSGQTLATGRGSADVPFTWVDVAVDPVAAGRRVAVCVRDTGDAQIAVFGTPSGDRTSQRGVVRFGEMALVFTTEPRSLLSRLPDALEHAALFKPGWVGTGTFWLLTAAILVGVPLLLGTALWQSLRAAPDEDIAPAARYARFRAEVEPLVLSAPRVHRFAAPPAIGDPDLEGGPVAVCVESREGIDPRPTLASLEQQTRKPAQVFEGEAREVLGATSAPWIAVVRAGDRLSPLAVERLGQAARLAPDAALVTCDEDSLSGASGRGHPTLRPGPSPDLLLARDLTSSLVCVNRERLTKDCDLEGPGWRYRLALGLGGAGGHGLAHVPAILAHLSRNGDSAGASATLVEEALAARGDGGARVEKTATGRRVRRALAGEPSVDVIILFRDRAELLERCARSVLESTGYENFRLRLVDNGSASPSVGKLVENLSRDRRVSAGSDPRPFNFAALNNAAGAESEADYLLFLNNDTEVITPSWIEELLEEAQRAEVGAVAPLLLYPDGSVQHVGAALGMHDYAGHPFAGLSPDANTPFGSAVDGTRNWLAVTAACMLLERRKFDEVGGFDESFVVAGNDVDLCLRLTERGYRSLCVPHVRLLHDESSTRGEHIDPADFQRSEQRYGEFRTIGDPFYNPNLTLTRTDCGLRDPDES